MKEFIQQPLFIVGFICGFASVFIAGAVIYMAFVVTWGFGKLRL